MIHPWEWWYSYDSLNITQWQSYDSRFSLSNRQSAILPPAFEVRSRFSRSGACYGSLSVYKLFCRSIADSRAFILCSVNFIACEWWHCCCVSLRIYKWYSATSKSESPTTCCALVNNIFKRRHAIEVRPIFCWHLQLGTYNIAGGGGQIPSALERNNQKWKLAGFDPFFRKDLLIKKIRKIRTPYQLSKQRGGELKLAKLILACSGWSLAHIRACELKLALFMISVHSNQLYRYKDVIYR